MEPFHCTKAIKGYYIFSPRKKMVLNWGSQNGYSIAQKKKKTFEPYF